MMQLAPTNILTLGSVERARDALNAAWNSIEPGQVRLDLARDYLVEANRELSLGGGHDGADDAIVAARLMLPRVTRATRLLDELGVAPTPLQLQAVLDELGLAMAHAEEALGAAGWD